MAAKKSGKKRMGGFWVNGGLIIICLLWTIPTLGLLISSFRDRVDINRTGWWTVLPHQDWVASEQIKPEPDVDRTQPMTLAGVTATFEEFRQGIEQDGKRLIWIGNRRVGYLEVQEQKITANTNFTLENYKQVLASDDYTATLSDGTTVTERGDNMGRTFLNSLAVAIPATIIPIFLAAMAAYGFAWMRFPARKMSFALVIALLAVPLQIALVPLLRDSNSRFDLG